jgi:hypothetical protein
LHSSAPNRENSYGQELTYYWDHGKRETKIHKLHKLSMLHGVHNCRDKTAKGESKRPEVGDEKKGCIFKQGSQEKLQRRLHLCGDLKEKQ